MASSTGSTSPVRIRELLDPEYVKDAADALVPAIEAARGGRDYVSSTGRRAPSWS